MLRFLHGGDFHLDAPFRALDAAAATEARREQRTLLERFSKLARDERVQLVFLTGDLFDGRRIYPETLKALREMLAEISCPVFLAPGNHDPYNERSPYSRFAWPKQVHIFKQESVEAVKVPLLGCTVYGAAFTESHRTSSPLRGLSVKGEGLHLGCFHGEVTTQPLSRYGPIHPDAIMGSGLHYLALGHVHSASGLQKAASTYYAYPGCPQGRGFDETGEKGVYLGTMDDAGNTTLQFRPLCLRQYRILRTDVTGRAPEDMLRAVLPNIKSADIARIILEGAVEEALDLTALQKIAASRFHSVELRDRTRFGGRIWERQNEESLLGLFLREMAAKMEQATPEEAPTLELALRFGLAALDGREAPE